MAKKVARISINKWEKTIEENIIEVPFAGCDGVTITIRTVLPLMEMLQFVEDVTASCFDDNTGEYLPEIGDFAFRKGVLSVFANFNMPDDVSKQYALICGTDAYYQVYPHIDKNQIESIKCAIREKVRYKRDMMQNAVVRQANEVIAQLNNLADQLEKSVSGVSGDSLKAFVNTIGNMGSVNEEKLAKAVLAERGDIQVRGASDNIISIKKPSTC